MLKKVMAAVGIGNTQVDTLLDDDTVTAGGTLEGEIVIQGGEVAQDLDALVLDLGSMAVQEVDDEEVRVPKTWASMRIAEPMTIEPGEQKTLAFNLTVPLLAPLSVGRKHPQSWVATRADIAMAIDPRDTDPLHVMPGKSHQAVFDAMEAMGFRLEESELGVSRLNPETGCVQEFEFKPAPGSAFSHLDEAEIAFLPSQGGAIDLLIQRDTKARSLGSLIAELAGTDEQHYRATLAGGESAEQVQELLSRALA